MSSLFQVTRRGSWVAACIAASLLAGCSSAGDVLSNINPLRERETILPGERNAVPGVTDPIGQVANQSVSVPGASGKSDWPTPGGNLSNNPGHVSIGGSGGFRSKVGEGTGRGGLSMFATPVVSGGRIYVYDPAGNVISVGTGGGRGWKRALRPEDEKSTSNGGGVSVSGSRVYAATGFGLVAALDAASGQTIWAKDLDTPALSAPVAANGKVHFITQDNTLVTLNAEDGAELWRYRGIPAAAGVLGSGVPAVVNNRVIAAYSSGELVSLSANDGRLAWADSLSRGNRTTAISSLSDVPGHPVVSGSTVIAAGINSRTIAVDLSSGRRQWETNIGSQHTPIVAGNAVFLTGVGGRVAALSKSDGSIQWITQMPTGTRKKPIVWTGPALANGALYIASNRGSLARIDASTGQVLDTRSISANVSIQPIAVGGRILMMSSDGTLIASN